MIIIIVIMTMIMIMIIIIIITIVIMITFILMILIVIMSILIAIMIMIIILRHRIKSRPTGGRRSAARSSVLCRGPGSPSHYEIIKEQIPYKRKSLKGTNPL